jgi:CPA1 family monovalent cation:H+ antiporter
MNIFEFVLILLAAVCLSNVVHRFIPVVSVPIVQIALGAAIAFLPLGAHFTFDPNLFFVLFVAPLIFYVSMMADKKTMWAQRKPILNMGVLLVFVTVLLLGYLVNFLIPAIPLAAAFALIAALGPTDDVAVASVGKRVNVPPKIMSLIQGESIINDASGIVSFQFALAAMFTGSFSLVNATGYFLLVGLGGIAVGLVLSWFKYILVSWIRSLGMESVTLHLLLGILTPFVVFLIAERLGVSGILAIFAAGITHSFNRDKFNPEKVNLNIASESVWSMLVFTLEGMVFVILGTQLPKILSSIHHNTYSVEAWEIVAYILLITFLLLLLRFVWSVFTIKKKNYEDIERPVNWFQAGIIFSLSGARGTVTLASVMSIPVLMSDGTAFPERDLIILIAGGVIVLSLLITSFILPLCVEKNKEIDKNAEDQAYLEILQNVIKELKQITTPENKAVIDSVAANYYHRIINLQRKQTNRRFSYKEERKMRKTFFEWEKEHTIQLLERGEVDEFAAQHYLDALDSFMDNLLKTKFHFKRNILKFIGRIRKVGKMRERIEMRAGIFALMETNARFVLDKIAQMEKPNRPMLLKIKSDYELRVAMYQRNARYGQPNDETCATDNETCTTVITHCFQIERDYIQAMLEAGRISRETAREMRHNISLLEVQLRKEDL